MGRRRRTGKASRRAAPPHARPGKPGAAEEPQDSRHASTFSGSASAPCSFVVKRGRLTPSARLLVQDLRMLMSPYCSSRLREKRSNKLKDFVAVSSLLGVTHLQALSQTEAGVYLKVAQLPNGPTLTFLVKKFTLMKDIRKAAGSKARNDARDFRSPALLLFSGGSAGEKEKKRDKKAGEDEPPGDHAALKARDVEQLVTKMMKNVFPAIDVQNVALSDCRRVALYRRQHVTASSGLSKTSFIYQFRQYAVVRRAAGVTSGVRRLLEAATRPAAEKKIFKSLGLREATKKSEQAREARAKERLRQGLERGALSEAEEDEASDGGGAGARRRRDLDICDVTLSRERGGRGSCFSDSEAEDDDENVVEFDAETAVAACPTSARAKKQSLDALLSSCAEGGLLREDRRKKRAADDDEEEVEADDDRDETWKMAVSLVELGPRMELQLVKIEEDVCAGGVLYHHFISKTPEELRVLKAKEAALKAERQRQREEMERAVEMQMKKKRKAEEASDASGASSEDESAGSEGKKGGKRERETEKRIAPSFDELAGALLEEGESSGSSEKGRKRTRHVARGEDDSDAGEESEADDDAGAAGDDEADEDDEGDGGTGRGGAGKRRKFHPFSFKRKEKKKEAEAGDDSGGEIPTVSERDLKGSGKDAQRSGARSNLKKAREPRGRKTAASMVLRKYQKAKERSRKSGKK
ncbi:brix domain-containing protein [Besnoitia besnoiti]|uniref:Brix domain-containing protein n=1 Tax=Besnoitia besnoiti TaxID=94643 RepID=A0A2A9MPU9_BESBE|nr:brix domain-containing protein [Besnoitia besnoiti]PFH38416.1 brix domain-containing protein [Besnoitia besnoiti]